MTLDFQLDEPDSPALRLETSFLSGRSRLYANGQQLTSEPRKGVFDQTQTFVVPLADGSQRRLQLKSRIYDPVPEVLVDGQPLVLARPLEVWEYILASIPLFLVFVGGFMGGAVGAGAAYANVIIMRSERNTVARVLICLGILVLALVAYGLLAWLLLG